MSSHLCKVFIETLLERADRAEQQLFMLSSQTSRKHTHTRLHGGYAPVSGWGGRSLDSSADDIIADRLETLGNRVRGINRSGVFTHNQNEKFIYKLRLMSHLLPEEF